VAFAPCETAKTVTMRMSGDTHFEPDEWIVVSFRKPTNATMGGFWRRDARVWSGAREPRSSMGNR